MKFPRKIFTVALYIFAALGLFFVLGFIAIKLHLTNVGGTNERILKINQTNNESATTTAAWQTTEEWKTLSQAIVADKKAIDEASKKTGIKSRLIVAQLVVEQLRLYTSNREIFKDVFEPLKILGIQSQYSWGIMGIKQETAIAIEENLKNQSSPFYLGPSFEHILDATSTNPDAVRFNRLTDEHDHSWAYLYAGLALKEVRSQWQHAGFPIENNPGVESTLYNIGFVHSKPNATPLVGGAEIDINNETYSFGSLAESFYNSTELLTEFPQ